PAKATGARRKSRPGGPGGKRSRRPRRAGLKTRWTQQDATARALPLLCGFPIRYNRGRTTRDERSPLSGQVEAMSIQRRKSVPVKVGSLWIGGSHPIAVQSMTTTDTADVSATVDQVARLVEAGSELV